MIHNSGNKLAQITNVLEVTLEQFHAEVAACKQLKESCTQLRESVEALLSKTKQFSQQNFEQH